MVSTLLKFSTNVFGSHALQIGTYEISQIHKKLQCHKTHLRTFLSVDLNSFVLSFIYIFSLHKRLRNGGGRIESSLKGGWGLGSHRVNKIFHMRPHVVVPFTEGGCVVFYWEVD